LRSKRTESRRLRFALAAFPLLLSVITGCGGDDLLLPSSGEPARVEIVGGNEQAATVGQPLPDSLIVLVTDPEERPVSGVEVVFVAPAGALAPNDTVITGPDGRAAVYYTLPTVSGEQTIEARAKPVVPSPSLTTVFRVSAQPEAAAELAMAGGDKQQAEVLTALPESLAVKALDRFGNGVAGVEVVWEATDGTVSPASVITGPDGRSATQRILGARPGIFRTSAVAPALENATIAFEATGVAPPSPQLILVAEPSSSAQAGVPFEEQPALQLQDAAGAPLPRADVAVTVQIADGAGSLGGNTTARSNGDGRVSFTGLSIRGRPGDRTLLFAASDFTPATSRTIDVNPGPPDAGQSSASVPNGTAGSATSMTIRLKDEFGTEIEDAVSAIRVRVEGANPTDVGVTDKGDGSYSAQYTPTNTGTDQVAVTVSGSGMAGSPFTSVVVAGPADPARTTAIVTRRFQCCFFWIVDVLVTTRDAHGNPLERGGAAVQVSDGTAKEVRDNGDGTYVARFPTLSPEQPVAITLGGVPIAGSPFTPGEP
jgi:hypothetical protein